MEIAEPTARPAHIVRLAEHLATAQHMADCGFYTTAFGYLEAAVNIALDYYGPQEPTQVDVGAREAALALTHGFDAADVWAGVESHPLF